MYQMDLTEDRQVTERRLNKEADVYTMREVIFPNTWNKTTF